MQTRRKVAKPKDLSPPPQARKKLPLGMQDAMIHIMGNEAKNVPTKDIELRKELNMERMEYTGLMSTAKQEFKKKFKSTLHSKEGKTYLVSCSKDDEIVASLPGDETEEAKDGFLATVLLMIFMEESSAVEGVVTEERFWDLLVEFGLDKHSDDPALGKISKLIGDKDAEFMSAGWLTKRNIILEETKTMIYEWGPRAVASVDPNGLLAFFCEVDDSNPKKWPKQRQAAAEMIEERKERDQQPPSQ